MGWLKGVGCVFCREKLLDIGASYNCSGEDIPMNSSASDEAVHSGLPGPFPESQTAGVCICSHGRPGCVHVTGPRHCWNSNARDLQKELDLPRSFLSARLDWGL